MKKGIKDEKIQEWIKRTNKGETISNIGKSENRAYSVIANAIRTYGKRKFRLLTTEERDKIKKDYKTGLSITDIMKKYDLNLGCIWYCIKKISYLNRQKNIKEFNDSLDKLSDFDIGYLIGIFEGEGCLNINCEKDENKIRYRVSLAVSNCDKRMVDFIRNKLKANISKNRIHNNRDNKNKSVNNWLPIYEWKLCDKKLLEPLFNKLYPYMICKKKEVEYMLKFIQLTEDKEKQKLLIKFRKEKYKKNTKVKIPKEEE